MTDNTAVELHNNPNPAFWAEVFVEMVRQNPSLATNEGAMIGWFANAMQAGEDKFRNSHV